MNDRLQLPNATFTARKWPWIVSQGMCVVALAGLATRTAVVWGQLGEQARLAHMGGMVFLIFLAIIVFPLSWQQFKCGYKLVEVYPDRLVLFKYGWPGEQLVLPRHQISSVSSSGIQYDTDAIDIIVKFALPISEEVIQSKVWSKTSPPCYWYTYANGRIPGIQVVEHLAKWAAPRATG